MRHYQGLYRDDFVCACVVVCERHRESLSDLKRERIFQDVISLAWVFMVVLYVCVCTYVCKWKNINVPVMHKP